MAVKTGKNKVTQAVKKVSRVAESGKEKAQKGSTVVANFLLAAANPARYVFEKIPRIGKTIETQRGAIDATRDQKEIKKRYGVGIGSEELKSPGKDINQIEVPKSFFGNTKTINALNEILADVSPFIDGIIKDESDLETFDKNKNGEIKNKIKNLIKSGYINEGNLRNTLALNFVERINSKNIEVEPILKLALLNKYLSPVGGVRALDERRIEITFDLSNKTIDEVREMVKDAFDIIGVTLSEAALKLKCEKLYQNAPDSNSKAFAQTPIPPDKKEKEDDSKSKDDSPKPENEGGSRRSSISSAKSDKIGSGQLAKNMNNLDSDICSGRDDSDGNSIMSDEISAGVAIKQAEDSINTVASGHKEMEVFAAGNDSEISDLSLPLGGGGGLFGNYDIYDEIASSQASSLNESIFNASKGNKIDNSRLSDAINKIVESSSSQTKASEMDKHGLSEAQAHNQRVNDGNGRSRGR